MPVSDTNYKRILGIVGVLVLSAGLWASNNISGSMPRMPGELGYDSGVVVQQGTLSMTTTGQELEPGDRILYLNSIWVDSVEQLNFLLDGLHFSDSISVEVSRKGQRLSLHPPLEPAVPVGLLATNIAVGCLFWLFGMLILVYGRIERDVVLFFAMSMTLSLVILVYWPENDFGIPGGRWLGALFSHGLYPLTVTLLLHFSLGFPAYSSDRLRRLAPLIYLPALAFSAALIWTQLVARSTLDLSAIVDHLALLKVFRVFLAVFFALSPLLWLYRLKRSRDLATRQKLKWLLFGFIAGIAPHIFLFELPHGLGARPLLSEQVTLLFSPLSAAGVVVAVVRYRLFDINLLINRSIVFTLLSLFVGGAYLGLVASMDALLAGHLESVAGIRIGVVLLLAVLFEPARRIAQGAVNRILFRRHHDERQALAELSRLVARTLDMKELAAALSRIVTAVLGVRRLAVFFLDDKDKKLLPVPLSDRMPDTSPLEVERFLPSSFAQDSPLVLDIEDPRLADFRLGLRLVAEGNLVGLVALGPKDRSRAFSDEDLRFLEAVAGQVALAFEAARAFHQLREINLRLEQKVFERTAQMAESNDRLVEQYVQLQHLDEMKETLTRMIVHDLRNPLATISLGSEFLRLECPSLTAGAVKTLETIESAARHMQDMIQSMLDTAKMEAGKMRLELRDLSARHLLEDCLERVRLQAEVKEISLELQLTDDLSFQADEPLFCRVLVNLLANAVRHSPARDRILVSALGDGVSGKVEFSVTNHGAAIPPKTQEKLFEKFFQAEAGAGGGAGLGLHFCHMVTEAHGGRIAVVSPLPGQGHGSKFVVVLPPAAAEKP